MCRLYFCVFLEVLPMLIDLVSYMEKYPSKSTPSSYLPAFGCPCLGRDVEGPLERALHTMTTKSSKLSFISKLLL